jgi:hypothetical protein
MTKEQEILAFLERNVFSPALNSPRATSDIKAGIRMTRMRMSERDASGMVRYFWSAVIGTDRSRKFARQMKSLGLTRFEEILDQFRDRFTDDWLATP